MRFRPTRLLACGIAVASSACSMDATSPSRLAPSATAAHSEAEGGDGSSDAEARAESFSTRSGKTTTYVVTVDPQRQNVLSFGDFTLDLPGNAICDQDSGYGLDVFDLDCKAERNPVTITAVVRTTPNGVPRIDLAPEMRFSPKRVVTLSLFVADVPPQGWIPRLLYCPTLATMECVDEAQLDSSLATQVDVASGTVFRRIKHFSGYYVEW